MNFEWEIARKYLLSKSLPKSVNIISIIASAGIMFGCIALVLVLSVFNGFYSLIYDLFQQFDPHIKITAAKGKYFAPPDFFPNLSKEIPEIVHFAYTIEGKAMLKYHDKQTVVHVKGVDEQFLKIAKINEIINHGTYQLKANHGEPLIVMGMGVAYYTNANLKDELNPMQLFTVSEKYDLISETDAALKTENVFPSGVFSLQKDYDDKIVIAHKELASKLFETEGKISAIEIKIQNISKVNSVKQLLEQKLGKDFKVQTLYEQHETLFKVMENEKRFGYIVLALMMFIAAVNIVGSLSLIVAHKKKDIGVLMTLGLSSYGVQKIFLYNGLITGLLGMVPGLILGALIAVLQQEFGFMKLQGGESFIVDHYPMSLEINDLILITFTVLFWVFLSSWYPARVAARSHIIHNLKN